MTTGSTVPNIQWDLSNTEITRPDVCKVDSTREELIFLFGSSIPGDGNAVRLQNRIIVSPFVAKRLSNLLRGILQDHESNDGLLNAEPSAPTGRPARPFLNPKLPPPKSEQGTFLFQLVHDLGVVFGYEPSFKMHAKTLLENRYVLTLDKNSLKQLAPGRMPELCGQIKMPRNLLADFLEKLLQAHCVHFGFEENKCGFIYKAYIEFSVSARPGEHDSSIDPGPALQYVGYKWDTSDNTKQAVSRYTRYPLITTENILKRVSNICDGLRSPCETVKGITDSASARISDDLISYLEVAEDNNPRSSFLIKFYNAELLVAELYPFLAKIGQYYSIPFKEFHGLYENIKDRTFGHVAGGIDRDGSDFLTVYYGMQFFLKRDAETPMLPTAPQLGPGTSGALNAENIPGVESRDEKARALFDAVTGLNVPIGLQRSFKAKENLLQDDRFLLGFRKKSIRQPEEMLGVCRKIAMPDHFLDMVQENLPEATGILFGFEGRKKGAFYKAYLELGTGFNSIKENSHNQDPFLLRLGFTWNVSDHSQKAITKYHCFPMMTEKDMLERLSSKHFLKNHGTGCFEIVNSILNLATCRYHPYEFLYSEAEEDDNPGKSFFINLHRANLSMKEIYPCLLKIGTYFSLPQKEYHHVYEKAKNLFFGHLQAGIDRTGKEFFTIYYGDRKPLGTVRI